MAKNMAVVENGEVVNIIWVSSEEEETETWKDAGDYPVGIGDTYTDGKYFRDGVALMTPMEEAYKAMADQEQAHLDELAELMEEIYQEYEGMIEE